MRASLALGRLIIAFVTAGCATLHPPPFSCPEKGGASWIEVRAPHFLLTTDLDRDNAEKLSVELEVMLDVLTRIGFESSSEPKAQISVVHFRNEEEYKAVAAKLSGGQVLWSGRHDFERAAFAVVEGEPWPHLNFVDRIREIVQHELTHVLTYTHFPQAPTWLNEGLAEYYSTLVADEDGTATMGRQPSHLGFRDGSWKTVYDDTRRRWVTLIPVREMPSASALLAMTPDDFYGTFDGDPETPAGYEASRQRTIHYGGAWNLVHLLKQDPKYAEAFSAYLNKLRAGGRAADAWREAFGPSSNSMLDDDFRARLAQSKVTALQTKYDRRNQVPSEVRALTDAEGHLLWARLRRWDTDENRAASLRDINEAARAPNSEQLALIRAFWEFNAGKLAAAEEILKKANRDHPNDRQILNALGWVRLAVLEKSEHREMRDVTIAMEPVTAALLRVAESATEFDLLGRYRLLKGDYDGGLAYEKRAIARDPSCVNCLATSAELLAGKGLAREALDTASLALALLPEGQRSPGLVNQVAGYKRILEGKTGNAASETRPTPVKSAPANRR